MIRKHGWLPLVVAALTLAACGETGENQGEENMEPGTEAEAAAPETGAEAAAPEAGVDTSSTDLATWNTDADARLAPEEFDAWLQEKDFYGKWNTDGAEGLTPDELAAGLIGVLDTNDDGEVTESEWQSGGQAWFGDASFADLDTDGNGSIDDAELTATLQEGEPWSGWDTDASGTLSREEFNAAVFSTWDENGDGFVDEAEWGGHFDAWS